MRPLPDLITDPVYEQPSRLTTYQKFWLKRIHDKRDLPFVMLLTLIHLTILPTAILLYTPVFGNWWWPVAIIYFYFSQFYLKGSFGLMLHCLCHRKFFRNGRLPYKYLFWCICPLFGHPGDSYNVHHLAMHHIENNMPTDSSCTMGYNRDSFSDFMLYWLKFMFLGAHDTVLYFFRRKRRKMGNRITISEIGFIVIATALCFVNLRATLVVLIIPYIFARFVMILGNWTQHAFVDPDEPDNDYASNIICLNTAYNRKCWNDGYHAIHHIRPGAHYTELPVLFRQMIPGFKTNKTFIFERIHYLHIFVYLMFKRYDKLASHIVNVQETFSGKDDAIALMKSRTKKFDLRAFAEKTTFSKN